jgi:16S rRNA (uracil1498-N3)-methyltransferase
MIPRIFVDKIRILEQTAYVAEREKVHRIRDVLRLKKGDRIVLLDNSGKEYTCTIEEPAQKRVKLKIEKTKEKEETQGGLHLYPALIKKNRFESILEKCTEIGVKSFTPLLSERTETEFSSIPSRWEKIAREAAEQSERFFLPEINRILPYKKALTDLSEKASVLVFSRKAKHSNLSEIKDNLKEGSEIHLFLGPEGGFTGEEVDFGQGKGAKLVSFGSRPLRAETAAIVASGILTYS